MRKEEAINVIESVINATLKAGLFQNIADFQLAVDALNSIKGETGQTVTAPKYTSTDSGSVKE